MTRHVRILLLGRDRYAAYRLVRTLESRLPDSIIVVFHSADSALEELTRNHYHLALVDFATVGLDGLKRIRSGHPQLPVIVLSDTDPSEEYGSVAAAGEQSVRWLPTSDRPHARLPRMVMQALGSPDPHPVRSHSQSEGPVRQGEELVRAVGRLAHNVNNPLMTILGMTELLLDEAHLYDPGLLRRLRVIRQSAGRIAASLNRLTRLVAGDSSEPGDDDTDITIGTEREDHAGTGSQMS